MVINFGSAFLHIKTAPVTRLHAAPSTKSKRTPLGETTVSWLVPSFSTGTPTRALIHSLDTSQSRWINDQLDRTYIANRAMESQMDCANERRSFVNENTTFAAPLHR